MREHLYRGKDSIGNWRFGNLIASSYEKDGNIEHVYSIQGINDKSYCSGIDEKSIGQYTGLTDRNEKKIFEGDIVQFEHGLMIVCWNEKAASFCLNYLSFDPKESIWFDNDINSDKVVVIGNIHDNKDLLK